MARVVQIGARRWLAGMTWMSYEQKPSKAEVKEDAQRLKSTWTCVRIGESCIQGGFCSAVDGEKASRLFSLAAMLADSNEQPWLGTFQLGEDLWWYVAVRDEHAILPEGDFIGTREEVFAAREQHLGYIDWKFVDGDATLLEELIDAVTMRRTPINSLTGTTLSTPVKTGVALLTLAGAAGAGYWYWQDQQAQEQQRLMALAQARARATTAAQQAAMAPPLPITTTPLPNDWIKACGAAVSVPISEMGWALQKVECVANAAMLFWHRSDGATLAYRPPGDVQTGSNDIQQVIPLAGLSKGAPNDAINLKQASTILAAWAQTAGFQFTLEGSVEAPPPALPGAAPTQASVPTQPKVIVTINTNVSMFSLDLSAIPGLRLTKANMTETGWKLEGVLYGR